jgi:predicted nucleic acid-binding protein
MNGSKLLVDTNIILYYLQGHDDLTNILTDYALVISFVTELELLSFGKLEPNDSDLINSFLKFVQIIDISKDIKMSTVNIRHATKLKLPDSIILATAVTLDIPFITADRGFSKVKDSRILLFEF